MQSVLIVEEDQVIRGLVRAIVSSAGYAYLEVSDGDEALKIAKKGSVDAVVLDCLGRSGHGMETLMRLRTDEHTSNIPVVAMCGLGQYGAELGLWAKAVVVKPFRPAQLLMKLQNALRATNATMYVNSSSSVLPQAI